MFWNNLKLAFRNAFKDKWILLINVIGLSFGLTAVILLTSYISIELKRGTHLANAEEVYSLQPTNRSRLSNPMVELFRERIPEINKLTAFHRAYFEKAKLTYNNSECNVSEMVIGDSLFFDIFNYPIRFGELNNALDNPNTIVLTKKIATNLFGNANPVGEQIILKATGREDEAYTVTAVIKDIPKDAMFQFEAIYSLNSLRSNPYFEQNMAHWGNCNYSAFFKLNNPELLSTIEEKANSSFQKIAPEWIRQDGRGFVVKPYKNLYFDMESSDGLLHSNKLLVNMLGIIGILILVVCLINYVNLNLAKEEGNNQANLVHKFLGAKTHNIINKGFFEMLPSLVIALIASLLLTSLLLPGFSNLVQIKIEFNELFSLSNSLIISSAIIISIVVCGLFSGIFQSRKIKKKGTSANTTPVFRSGLIVTQFIVSIAFIVFTISLIKQLKFMQNKPMGFQSENIIHLNLQGELEGNHKSFKTELLKIPGITDVTFASSVLGNVQQHWGMSLKNNGVHSRIGYNAMIVDKNFFDFYGIKLIEGTNFFENSEKEKHHIFNESAIKSFGIKDITHSFITAYSNAKGDIIGVVEDFNFQKLDVPISNLGFQLADEERLENLFLKTDALSAADISTLLDKIEKVWLDFVPDWPLEYGFQDQTIKELYENEVQFSKILILAAIVALIIACIGLLGISIYTIERRIKEIGIRKVNGAKIRELLAMLNKDFAKYVVIAFLISCPLSYLLINKLLQNFAYKTQISWWIFAGAGATSLIIALITVSFQSYRAANRNPVEALRYE